MCQVSTVTVLPSPRWFGPQTEQITPKQTVYGTKMLVPLTALNWANSDFSSQGWKILISWLKQIKLAELYTATAWRS